MQGEASMRNSLTDIRPIAEALGAELRKAPEQTQNICELRHVDRSCDAAPALRCTLLAREVPDFGGDTAGNSV
jgi:hypothetical protein